jgi:hypothetical protein
MQVGYAASNGRDSHLTTKASPGNVRYYTPRDVDSEVSGRVDVDGDDQVDREANDSVDMNVDDIVDVDVNDPEVADDFLAISLSPIGSDNV